MVSQCLEDSGWMYAAAQSELPGERSVRRALSLAHASMKRCVLEDLALPTVGTYFQADLCIKVKVIPKSVISAQDAPSKSQSFVM